MTKLVTIILFATVLMLVVACKPSKTPPTNDSSTSPVTATSADSSVQDGNIVYLEYSEYGTMAQPNEYYKVEMLENGCVKVKRQRGMDEEEFVTDGTLIAELKKIYDDGQVSSWKESYEPECEVLDGYSWNIEVKFDTGYDKCSHGNNARPESDALKQFSNIIWNLKK